MFQGTQESHQDADKESSSNCSFVVESTEVNDQLEDFLTHLESLKFKPRETEPVDVSLAVNDILSLRHVLLPPRHQK